MNENQRLTLGDYFERIFVFIGLVVIVLIVQIPLSFIGHYSQLGNLIAAAGYLAGFGVAISVVIYCYRKYAQPPKRSFTGRNISMIFMAYGAFLAIEVILQLLNQAVYHQQSTANNDVIYQLMSTNRLTLILMGFTAVFCSPILEETVFRGFLIGAFFKRNAKVAPMIVSGVLFAIPHMEDLNIFSFLVYASLGGILAFLYIRTNDIRVPIGLHFLNNLIAMGMMILQVSLTNH